jgi:hypothetical protein
MWTYIKSLYKCLVDDFFVIIYKKVMILVILRLIINKIIRILWEIGKRVGYKMNAGLLIIKDHKMLNI